MEIFNDPLDEGRAIRRDCEHGAVSRRLGRRSAAEPGPVSARSGDCAGKFCTRFDGQSDFEPERNEYDGELGGKSGCDECCEANECQRRIGSSRPRRCRDAGRGRKALRHKLRALPSIAASFSAADDGNDCQAHAGTRHGHRRRHAADPALHGAVGVDACVRPHAGWRLRRACLRFSRRP